jgi:enoyl-CoA hydratase/3-hydroxyacyl-CoA dehydrogenase
MKVEDIKKIAVIGAGDMGHGIAEVALLGGYRVALSDISQEFAERGLNRIKESLIKLTEKGKVSEDSQRQMLGSIETFTSIADAVKDADFVIEAVPEVMSTKKDVFRELDSRTPGHAVLASNTSNMSITEIAGVTRRPEKVVGMHYFNPAVLMKLVEVIRGANTSDETMQLTCDLALKMNKVPVKVEKDSAGFIYNRINAPVQLFLNEIVARVLAEPEEIDAAVRKTGMPMGPYELMDYVGNDVVYHESAYFAEKLSPDYTPAKWLKEMVDAGRLGKKSGQGIFDWSKGRPIIDMARAKADFHPNDILALQVNEATKLLEEGVASSPDDVDTVIINGGGATSGPFQEAREIGFDKIAKRCEELADKFGKTVFRPTETLRRGNI